MLDGCLARSVRRFTVLFLTFLHNAIQFILLHFIGRRGRFDQQNQYLVLDPGIFTGQFGDLQEFYVKNLQKTCSTLITRNESYTLGFISIPTLDRRNWMYTLIIPTKPFRIREVHIYFYHTSKFSSSVCL